MRGKLQQVVFSPDENTSVGSVPVLTVRLPGKNSPEAFCRNKNNVKKELWKP